mmetsp:Transcript_4354/g.11982  ORF Transcript_4354/g.11982 Transcript_4354/m.11982 type:complete len:212 (+) Transcript_4354:408-1043(+)
MSPRSGGSTQLGSANASCRNRSTASFRTPGGDKMPPLNSAGSSRKSCRRRSLGSSTTRARRSAASSSAQSAGGGQSRSRRTAAAGSPPSPSTLIVCVISLLKDASCSSRDLGAASAAPPCGLRKPPHSRPALARDGVERTLDAGVSPPCLARSWTCAIVVGAAASRSRGRRTCQLPWRRSSRSRSRKRIRDGNAWSLDILSTFKNIASNSA